MGLLSRLKDKVKSGLGAVSEEAKHPGRPPAHKASENPFHDQPGERAARETAAKNAKDAADPARKKNAGDDKPWYLDGSNDGWDEVNPEKDQKK
jgi:hypothetical protein